MLRISVSKLGEGSQRLITMTDMTSLSQRRARLKEEVESRDAAVRELEDRRRNIDAYLEALYEIPDLKERQELFDKVQHDTERAFDTMLGNMEQAADDIPGCGPLLEENLETARKSLAEVRAAVARLKEGQ